MCDWQKRLQPHQERISSLNYKEGLTCHRSESSWTNYIIISVRLRSKYILTSHWLSLSLHYYVFPHISTDIDSPINQNDMCTCNHLEWLLTLSIGSRSFKIRFWNVLNFNSGFMNIAGKKCFWNHMYQKIVQMINLSQNILWTSYKILFTIKSGGLCYQNYLKYIISNYGKGFGMCCYFNSGWKKLILKIEIPLKYCNENAWWPVYKTYFGLFTKDYLQ